LHSSNNSKMTLRPRGHLYDVPRVYYLLLAYICAVVGKISADSAPARVFYDS